MLFYRSVQIFHEEKYDFDTEDVRETLCERFRNKSLDKDHEYICQTCHRDLRKGKIPVQATANQLEVPHIPEQLCSLTQLEVHCISLRIPFMAI